MFQALIALGVLVVILLIWVLNLSLRLKKFLTGQNGRSLEGAIREIINNLAVAETARREINQQIEVLHRRLRQKVNHVRTVRFNPFAEQGQGGNHSFATAFLDEEGNGVVLSSLYSREKVNIYAKPINRRTSEYELTAEEQSALDS